MNLNKSFKLIVAVSISGLAGIIGSAFTMPAIQSGWYAALVKPALNPPGWIFGSVWTTLYLLMGVSVWLIWEEMGSRPHGNDSRGIRNDNKEGENDRKIKIALVIFDIHLILNVFWSIIFFGLRSPGMAFVVKEPIEGIISGGVLRVKLKEDIEPEYLALVINSIIGQSQV